MPVNGRGSIASITQKKYPAKRKAVDYAHPPHKLASSLSAYPFGITSPAAWLENPAMSFIAA
jgi:hypothetical protein